MSINKNYAPKLYKSTANMTVREWEDARRNSLGGSDMAILLGLSPYENTKRSLYYDKIGVKPVTEISKKQEIIFNSGHFLENMVANLFSFRTGLETYEIKAMFEHPHYPFIRGNIDRFYRRRGEKAPLGFLECKSTSEFNTEWGEDEIPTQYKVQIATYLSILNMDRCRIACLFIPESLRWVAGILYQMKNVFGALSQNILSDIKDQIYAISDSEIEPYVPMVLAAIGGEFLIPNHLLADCSNAIGKNFITRDFERDENLEELILVEAEKFWKNNVEKRIEPSLKGEKGSDAIATLTKYVPSFKANQPITLPDGDKLAENAKKIKLLKGKKSDIEKKSKEIDSQIEKLSVPFIEALNGADAGQFNSDGRNISVSYKSSVRKSVSKDNISKLKESYPDVYDEFVTETVSKPTLKIGR